MKLIIPFIFLFSIQFISSQDIPVNLNEKDIYSFLDELASEKIITLNTSIQPYSRKTVAMFLNEAKVSGSKLNARQKKELDWYLLEYKTDYAENKKTAKNIELLRPNKHTAFSIHPLGFYYGDSMSQLVIKPIWGIQYMANDNGSIYHRWGGAQAYASYKNWGFYASLRDNHESQAISKPLYLTSRTGGNYKGLDYSEMLGGISYSKDWLTVGLAKDFYTVGTNYSGSNILSDRAPSFAHVKLKLTPWKWFEFNYMHGWLISNVLDSVHSYTQDDGIRRDVMHKKYIATNMFTLRPWKTLNVSFGNSIIYSDYQLNPAYLIPFMFFKSVDHSNNSTDGVGKNVGQNSSMFFELSFRGIKHLHLYHVQFIDELKIARWSEPDQHNFYSQKTGFLLSNWPAKHLFLTAEYTKTVPTSYQHDINTTTYTSNGYNLGHYMRDNSDVLFFELRYHPIKNIHLTTNYTFERKGEDYGYVRSDPNLTRRPFMDDVKYKRSALNFAIDYEPTFGLHLFVNTQISNTSGSALSTYSPAFFRGKLFTVSGGFNLGF